MIGTHAKCQRKNPSLCLRLSSANTPIMISSVYSLQLQGGVLIHSNERALHGDGMSFGMKDCRSST